MQKRFTATQNKSYRAGFTLIEILAATSIMVLVTILVLALSSQVMSMWSRSVNTLGTNYEARIALDKLAQDIESAVLRRNGKVWFIIEPDEGTNAAGQPHLMFYAAIPDRPDNRSDNSIPSDTRDRTGDVCAISYRIAYRNLFNSAKAGNPNDEPNPTTPPPKDRFGLYRAIVDARTTFLDALATDSPHAYWINPGGSEPGDGPLDRDTWSYSTDNLLSLDVAVLQIDVTYEYETTGSDGVTSTQIATMTEVNELEVGDTIFISDGTDTVENAKQILYFDIRLGVLGEEGARALHSDISLSDNDANRSRVEEAMHRYGQWYTRRVTLRSTPI